MLGANQPVPHEHAAGEHARVGGRARAAELLRSVMTRHRDTTRLRYVEPYRNELQRLGRPVFGPTFEVDVDSDLILARWQNRVYAFSLKCPHRGTRLEWHADERRIFCPKHKARFTPDGAHDTGRQSRDLDRYAIARQGGSVAVDLGAVLRVDTDAKGWAAAVVAL